MESRDSRREVSKQIKFLDFKLECLQIERICLIYRLFGCNRPIETNDGYDGTVHRGPFQLSCSRPILMDGPDEPRG